MMNSLKRYFYLYFTDHGLLRFVYQNFHRLPGNLYRCNQPSPRQLARYAKKYGIKTVVNLRGGDETNPSWQLENKACLALGLKLVNLRLLSRSFPTPGQVLAACEAIEQIEYPALVHCKSGADRAGFFSTLYRIVRLGEPVEIAIKEMGLRYGHISWAQTGVLDEFFLTFKEAQAAKAQTIKTWVVKSYCREQTKSESTHRGLLRNIGNVLTDKLLRRE